MILPKFIPDLNSFCAKWTWYAHSVAIKASRQSWATELGSHIHKMKRQNVQNHYQDHYLAQICYLESALTGICWMNAFTKVNTRVHIVSCRSWISLNPWKSCIGRFGIYPIFLSSSHQKIYQHGSTFSHRNVVLEHNMSFWVYLEWSNLLLDLTCLKGCNSGILLIPFYHSFG